MKPFRSALFLASSAAALAMCGCGRRVTVIEGPNGGRVTRVHRPLRRDVTIVEPAPRAEPDVVIIRK